ncbi:Protein of unknown function DUF968 [uncultured Caudovirales phage]|uniref:DUF968 domain-containing protein n=1 Tax=uncultured Caudovirales phage TaxID=2100421 RepID=A0A6J5RJC0_9CAUD|nr:Protein of unknown function DUF968 [uncultured Caudovirales phage]
MKLFPANMSYAQALRSGHLGKIEDRRYLDWVKTLPCCSCHAPADDPHHMWSRGYNGHGSRSPDYFAIPLCRACHDGLHRDVNAWESLHGPQIEHVALTLLRAICEEKLVTARRGG